MSASLTNQDVAGQYELTIGTLHTQPLGFGITAVLGGTNTLLMRKELPIPLQQFLHLRNRYFHCTGIMLRKALAVSCTAEDTDAHTISSPAGA